MLEHLRLQAERIADLERRLDAAEQRKATLESALQDL
jgi:hypothetical protein